MKRIRWTVTGEQVMALSALVTAVASICVSVWLGMETRRHNRLSVRPRLDITFNAGSRSVGYEVTNHGLGPALITGLDVRLDGREQSSGGLAGFDEMLGVVGASRGDLVVDALGPGAMLPAGESRRIFAVLLEQAAGLDSLLRELYTRTALEVRYESMYQEPFRCRLP